MKKVGRIGEYFMVQWLMRFPTASGYALDEKSGSFWEGGRWMFFCCENDIRQTVTNEPTETTND